MNKSQTIDRDTYLKVLGLFTLTNEHFLKAQEAQASLIKLLNMEDHSGFIGELCWDSNVTIRLFDEALAKDGFTVDADTPLPNGERG